MAILAGDIKKGVCLRLDDGKIWVVIDFLHKKPGKGNTVMITKLRNVEDGRVLERTWIVSAKLDDVTVSHQQFQYLYKEGDDMVFMNTETFEQVNIAKSSQAVISSRKARQWLWLQSTIRQAPS